jgi:hypothetical protein
VGISELTRLSSEDHDWLLYDKVVLYFFTGPSASRGIVSLYFNKYPYFCTVPVVPYIVCTSVLPLAVKINSGIPNLFLVIIPMV